MGAGGRSRLIGYHRMCVTVWSAAVWRFSAAQIESVVHLKEEEDDDAAAAGGRWCSRMHGCCEWKVAAAAV
jgi:hypothetical protein